MSDPTEDIRRELLETINAAPQDRATLEAAFTQVWDTDELQRDFTVLGFMAPFVMVRRKADGLQGVLMFQHAPRFYFAFEAS